MSGQALMCVWQAVAAADPKLKGTAPASRVRHITIQYAKKPDFQYTESAFQTAFPGNAVTFDAYRKYVTDKLVSKTTPQQDADKLIEAYCWEVCSSTYSSIFTQHPQLSVDDYFKLWQMFNRICIPASCPPAVEVTDMNWWANKLAAPMGKNWADLPQDAAPLTYSLAIELLNAAVFSQDGAAEAIRTVDQLHAWIVREVSITGWLYKRTRKQPNNWTMWMRRYCVLTPGQIRYYTSAQQRERDFKGKVAITNFSRLESLNDYKSLIRNYSNRFRISNQPIVELELSALFEHEKGAWMSAITEVIDACKSGTTPVQAVLADRLAMHTRGKPRQTIDQAVSKLKSKRLSKIPDTLLNQEQINEYNIPAKPPTVNSPVDKHLLETSPTIDAEADSEEEVFDNNTYAFEKSKVQAVFDQIDTDKNGLLDEREFDEFVRMLVGRAADADSRHYLAIFENLVEDGDRVVEFDSFYSYFTRLVLDQTPKSEAEAALKAEFLGADKEGLGAVDFKDLAEFVWDRRRSFRYRKLLLTLEESPAKREAWCPILTGFIRLQYGGDGGFGQDLLNADALGNQIQGSEEEEVGDLAERISIQWHAFTTDQHLRSTDAYRIAARFNLVDVVCHLTARGQRPPVLSVDAARWEAYEDYTQLVFPAGTPLEVPAVNATDALLQYYGCRLADAFHERVALFYENRIEDLGYSNQSFKELSSRMAGGPGLDKSSLSRFDCPLSSNSGYLVLARWEGDEETLEVTAFRVPANRSVYIPADTMYSLDYTGGSWRTLNHPSPVKVTHAELKRQFTETNEVDMENVRFTFN